MFKPPIYSLLGVPKWAQLWDAMRSGMPAAVSGMEIFPDCLDWHDSNIACPIVKKMAV